MMPELLDDPEQARIHAKMHDSLGLAIRLLLRYCPAAFAARPWELMREVSRYADLVGDADQVERYCETLARTERGR